MSVCKNYKNYHGAQPGYFENIHSRYLGFVVVVAFFANFVKYLASAFPELFIAKYLITRFSALFYTGSLLLIIYVCFSSSALGHSIFINHLFLVFNFSAFCLGVYTVCYLLVIYSFVSQSTFGLGGLTITTLPIFNPSAFGPSLYTICYLLVI